MAFVLHPTVVWSHDPYLFRPHLSLRSGCSATRKRPILAGQEVTGTSRYTMWFTMWFIQQFVPEVCCSLGDVRQRNNKHELHSESSADAYTRLTTS